MFFLEDTSFSIEILDVVKPGDAIGNPYVGGFKAILE
jgi:hypothetical protein